MARKDPAGATAHASPSPQLAVVHWMYPDGSTICGCPLERERAAALAEAYRQMYPGRRCWLSVPPALAARPPGRSPGNA
jgi:hypothetical protein